MNYLERYQSYRADTNDQPLTDGRTDRRTDTQNVGGYNILPRHFLWRGIKSSPLEKIKTGFGTVSYQVMVGEQKYYFMLSGEKDKLLIYGFGL